jgi:hypothetical protein
MADKLTGAKFVNKEQRKLEIEQKEAFGMSLESENHNLDLVAIGFQDKLKDVYEKTIKQNGRIESVKASLNKDSPKRKEYDKMVKSNNKAIEIIPSFEEEDKN